MIEVDHQPVERIPRGTRIRTWLTNRLKALAEIAVVLLGLVTVASFFARWHHLAELLVHFRVQYFIGAVAAAIVLMALRQRGLATLAILILAINGWEVLPRLVGRPAMTWSSRTYTALVANVYSNNPDTGILLSTVQESEPDILVLLELTPQLADQMRQLHDLYPHRVARPRDDNFGIGLYSRLPISDYAVQISNKTQIDSLSVTLSLTEEGQGSPDESMNDNTPKLHVIATHPPPPGSSTQTEDRNADLEKIATLAADSTDPVLLLGDLNTTPWSPAFKDLISTANLRDGANGFGVQPTWPMQIPWLFRIPIDHTLVSESIQVINRKPGPDIGSDHSPVWIEFHLAE